MKGKFAVVVREGGITLGNKNYPKGSLIPLSEYDKQEGRQLYLDSGDDVLPTLMLGTDVAIIKPFEVGKYYFNGTIPFYVAGQVETQRHGRVNIIETSQGVGMLPLHANSEGTAEMTSSEFWEKSFGMKTIKGEAKREDG